MNWLWGGFGPVVFQWFSGGLSGKLFEVARQHCLFLQGERVSMRKRSAQVLRAEKNPHTCACHATLAAEHERSKSLCVSPTSTRGFGLQDLGPRRLRPRKACGNSGSACEFPVTLFWHALSTTCSGHPQIGDSAARTCRRTQRYCSFFELDNGALVLMKAIPSRSSSSVGSHLCSAPGTRPIPPRTVLSWSPCVSHCWPRMVHNIFKNAILTIWELGAIL